MEKFKLVLSRILAFLLWAITIGLGAVDIYFLREIFFAIYARFSLERQPAIFWGSAIVLIGAIIFVGFLVITSEYHLKNLGKHESWDLFTRTLVVELAIPFIAYFMV